MRGEVVELQRGNAPFHVLRLEVLLQKQLVLDGGAVGHGTLALVAVFGVVAAQGDQLPANGARLVVFELARLGVRDNALHFVTTRQMAVAVPALARMHQRSDATLDGHAFGVVLLLLLLLRVSLLTRYLGACLSDVQTAYLLHLVLVTDLLVTTLAQVVVLQWRGRHGNVID